MLKSEKGFLRILLFIVIILLFIIAVFIFKLDKYIPFIPNLHKPKVLWQYIPKGFEEFNRIILDKGLIYAYHNSRAFTKPIIVFDKNTGKEMRRIPMQNRVSEFSYPTIIRDSLYFFGTTDINYQKKFFALDSQTGQEKWSVEAIYGASLNGEALPLNNIAVVGNSYFGDASTIAALDLETGKQIWEQQIIEPKTPMYFTEIQGIIFVVTYENLYALNANTGQIQWQLPAKGWLLSKPVFAEGAVVFNINQDTYAVDAASGKEKWHFITNGLNEHIGDSPVVIGDAVYAKSDRAIYILDKNQGKILSILKLQSGGPWNIHAEGSTLYYTDSYGICILFFCKSALYAFDTANNREKWHFDSIDDRFVQFVVDGDVVYLISGLGLYALK